MIAEKLHTAYNGYIIVILYCLHGVGGIEKVGENGYNVGIVVHPGYRNFGKC